MTKTKGLIGFLGNTALAFLSTLVLLGVLEIALRVSKVQPGLGAPVDLLLPDEQTGFRLKPGLNRIHTEKDYSVPVKINQAGFRSSREYSLEKKEGVVRVAVVGDSFTFGTGVGNGEAFPDVMQGELGEKYEVMNMGIPGFGTANQAAFLKEFGLQYKPDIVLVAMFMGNDLADNGHGLYTVDVSSKRKPLKKILKNFYLYHFLRARMYAFMRGFHYSEAYRPEGEGKFDSRRNYALDLQIGLMNTEKYLMELKQLCEERQIKLGVLLIPFKHQILEGSRSLWADYDTLYEPGEPQKSLKGLLEAKGINRFLDLLPLMRNSPAKQDFYYASDPHCTPRGYHFIGQQAAEFLKGI